MINDQSPSKAISSEPTKVRKYDLEDRTHTFSIAVRKFVKELPRTISNMEDVRQLVRSSGSVCANYVEANEAISKKDFLHRIKICRKEAKESWHWIDCIDAGTNPELLKKQSLLIKESQELVRIFTASIRTLQNC